MERRTSLIQRVQEQIYNLAREIIGNFLDIRLKTMWFWTLGLTTTLVNLRGMEQIMYDMYDYPDELHKLMGFSRDGHMAKLDYLQKNGLLSLNTEGYYVGSGGFGFTDELPKDGFNPRTVRTIDMWVL